MSKLVLTLPALYKDNSLHKEILKKKNIFEKCNKLENQLQKVEKTRKALSSLVKIEDDKEQLFKKLKQEICARNLENEKMNIAANFIQMKTKELKMQQKITEYEIETLESKISQNLNYISKSVDYIFWNLGNAAIDSSNKIKQAYKRSKFREKIDRIRKVYKILQRDKKTLCRAIIRKSLRVFACKIAVEALSKEKEQKIINDKVLKIRKNLALIAIKRFWSINKFSLRKFMYRCKKYQHLLKRQKLTKYLSVDYSLQSEMASYISTPKNEASNNLVIENQEAAKQAALKLLKEKQSKLNSSLISYNIRKFRNKEVIPLSLSIIEERPKLTTLKVHDDNSNIGYSSKTIGYSNYNIGQSNGSLTTRSASHRHRIIRF